MKKLGYVVPVVALVLLTACSKNYDDSDLQKRLDNVEIALGAVESALEAYKAQVTAYGVFVSAFESGSYVSSVDEIKEGDKVLGYRISFGDGIPPVVIMNGEDGTPGQDGAAGYTPELGIVLKDGRYYWSVDGNIREDMPASPDTGSLGIKNGETPEILVKDGNWIMKTSKGEEVLGPVSDSDVLVTDTLFGNVGQADGVLTVTLNAGTVMKFPLLTEYSVVIADTSEQMVKEYRIGGKFTTPSLNVICPYGWAARVQGADSGLSGTITLLPPASVLPGIYTFNVLVTDGSHSTSASFAVTVPDNQEGGLE